VEVVRAALGHEVDPEPRRLLARVEAARGELHLLEGAVVVVGGARPDRGRVGDRHAVHVPHRVRAVVAARGEDRLLAALRPPDVDAIELHARHELQQHPRVARRRHLVQHLLVEVGDVPLRPDVERRRLGRHLDLFLHAGHAHLHPQVHGGADADDHVLAHERREAGERGAQGVAAGVEVVEAELALAAGDRLAGPRQRGRQLHDGAGQDGAAGVGDDAEDGAPLDLRGRRGREAQEQRGGQEGRDA